MRIHSLVMRKRSQNRKLTKFPTLENKLMKSTILKILPQKELLMPLLHQSVIKTILRASSLQMKRILRRKSRCKVRKLMRSRRI